MGGDADLVLAFGDPEAFGDTEAWQDLRRAYPRACLVTAGVPSRLRSPDEPSMRAVAVQLGDIRCRAVVEPVEGTRGAVAAGRAVGFDLGAPGLRHVLVLGGGPGLVGQGMAAGLASSLPAGVTVSGGVFGAGVGLDGPPEPGRLVGVGLSGEGLEAGVEVAGEVADVGVSEVRALARGCWGRPGDGSPGFGLLLACGELGLEASLAARQALGGRVAMLAVPVRESIARTSAAVAPLCFRSGALLAAFREHPPSD